MKKRIMAACAILAIFCLGFASLEQAMFGPEGNLPIVDSAILFSKQVDPSINGEEIKSKIKKLADEIRPRIENEKSPQKILDTLRECVYERWGFDVQPVEGIRAGTGYYDTLIRMSRESPKAIYENSFLVPVLEKKQGNCLGLTSVYLALAEELKLPLYPVVVPYHIFPRYDDGNVRINIETTAYGANLSDEFYAKISRISKQAIRNGAYLKTLSAKDFFSSYFLALGSIYAGKGLYKKAQTAFQDALRLSPRLALAYSNLAFIYSYYGVSTGWSGAAKSSLAIDPDFLGGYLSLSDAFTREGKYADAISVMKEVVKKHPDIAFTHASLGELYVYEGRFNEAIHSIWQAIRIDNEEPDFYVSLAKVYYFKKDYARAWKYAHRARRLGLKNPDIFYRLMKESQDPKQYPGDEK
ncbi:MAG: tetratricopeptide repeat protein [Candidatus Omnitrophica bacterium]|nr:tetratricopeptide repeat protein [Candidatus Omnitrophota bacterium]